MTVSIDVKRHSDGAYEVVTHCGRRATGLDPVRWASDVEQHGAGEILLGSVKRDGTMKGYDLEITRAASEAVRIPVIASGGAGSYKTMAEAIEKRGAEAVEAERSFT